MSHRDSDGPAGTATGGAGPLDLNLLRTFLTVRRSGSFTAAARALGLSQPTVTTQVRALERQLGHKLFDRQARGAVPLPFADDLAARVAAPLDALAAVGGHGGADDAAADPVHVAGPAELLCVRVLPALAPLVATGLRLRVTPGLTDPLLDELRGGRYDLVISTARPRGRSLTAVPLMDEEFVLVAAPRWAGRIEGELPGALHRVPLVVYADDLPIARRYWRHVFGRRLSCEPAVTVPDLRGVVAALTAGAGWSVLPRYLCLAELAAGTLVALHEPEDPPINTGFLVQRPGLSANAQVARVRDRLLQAARAW